jgi:excisionase family DNA binding protein
MDDGPYRTEPSEPRHWLTLEEAARRVRVSTRTLQRWTARGLVPAYRPTPRVVRYRLVDIDGFIASCRKVAVFMEASRDALPGPLDGFLDGRT